MSTYISHSLIKEKSIQARIYQQLLFTESVKNNTIIILPTGLGKTIIMLLLIAHFLKKIEGGVIIIAPTRPLVEQHYTSIIEKINLPKNQVVVLSGATSPEKRTLKWRTSRIIVTTPQTLRNDLVSNRCDVNEFSLVCFDEVHRATGDDPLVLIAEQFVLKNPACRIVGFTASPGNKKKLLEIVKNLNIQTVKYMDEDDPRVKPYIIGSDEEVKWISMPANMKSILSLLQKYIKKHLIILKELGVISSIQEKNITKKIILGIPSKLKSNRSSLDESDYFKGMAAYGQLMMTMQGQEMLETQGILVFNQYLSSKLEEQKQSSKSSIRRFLSSVEIQSVMKDLDQIIAEGVSNPKIEEIKKVLSSVFVGNTDSRVLIFTNFKATVNYIVSEISHLDGIVTSKFIGQSNSKYGSGMKQKEQKDVMNKFKSGLINVLVSTSVGEEGLDVAQCDYVIFYDIPPSSTRLIQRGGRTGRARKGKIIYLIIKGTRDEAFHFISKRRRRALKLDIEGVVKEMKREKNEKLSLLPDFFYTNEDKSNKRGEQDDKIEFGETQDLLVVYIDYREKGSTLLRELLKRQINIKQIELPIGDFVVSQRVGIERKTIGDFCSSVIDGRLFEQLSELRKTFHRPVLILEGQDINECRLSHNAFMGAISSVLIDYQIPIMRTLNQVETIDLIESLAKRENSRKLNKVHIPSRAQQSSVQNNQINVLTALPNINVILAEKLLREFQTLKSVFSKHPDELRTVHGIGINIANNLDRLFNTPFDESESSE